MRSATKFASYLGTFLVFSVLSFFLSLLASKTHNPVVDLSSAEKASADATPAGGCGGGGTGAGSGCGGCSGGGTAGGGSGSGGSY